MFPTDGPPAEDELKPNGEVETDENTADADSDEALQGEETEAEEVVEKLQQENKLLLEQLQRARADMDNYRRRVQRDEAQARRRIQIQQLREVLPIHDDLLLASNTADDSFEQLRDGLRMILEKFDRVLSDANVEAIPSVGESFDPNLHDAMFQEETSEAPAGQILAEFERGYRLGDDLLRPARVKVAKAPPSEEQG